MAVAVKICGIADNKALTAAAEGARWAGFVFFSTSPRAVRPERAAQLITRLPADVVPVGLFVNANDETIRQILNIAPVRMLQLHGTESPARVRHIRARFGLPVIKAVPVGGPEDIKAAHAYLDNADWMLFDARPPKGAALPGGTGTAFDWRLMAGQDWPGRWMLAGGLNRDNLAEAVRLSGARAVDVSSGVEKPRGHKNPDMIRGFLAEANRCP